MIDQTDSDAELSVDASPPYLGRAVDDAKAGATREHDSEEEEDYDNVR
jgi:hypothetical protein